MNEWGVVTVLIALAGLGVTVVNPLLRGTHNDKQDKKLEDHEKRVQHLEDGGTP